MKHPFDVHVGSKLRQCRCKAGMSRRQLGEMLGLEAWKIHALEAGTDRIDPNLMRRIVAAMNVPAAVLFDGLSDALSNAA